MEEGQRDGLARLEDPGSYILASRELKDCRATWVGPDARHRQASINPMAGRHCWPRGVFVPARVAPVKRPLL